jgi:hypothetical protein
MPHLQSTDARILDIGCATGGLLSAWGARGFRYAIGADPSLTCAEYARRCHGVEVRVEAIARMGSWTERFELITMVGVLEHLRDVGPAIGVASKLLAPGGMLYCAVPDVQGVCRCANAPFQQFSVEHVNFFTLQSLCAFMAGAGMEAIQTWRHTVQWREDIYEPVASGLFKLGRTVEPGHDSSTEPGLADYISQSSNDDDRFARVLDGLRQCGEQVIVWGAGTLTRRLLAAGLLSKENILAFVDSNPLLQGSLLVGRPILPPDELLSRKEDILICTGPFEHEIIQAIRTRLCLKKRIISLRGTVG